MRLHRWNRLLMVLIVMILTMSLGLSQDLVRVSEEEARKLLVNKVDPEYPPLAKQMRLSGRVQVDCYIDPAGAVEKVTILDGNPLFSSSINRAMKQWKFKPVEASGKATNAVANFVFNFRL